jgi:hypothetical protein
VVEPVAYRWSSHRDYLGQKTVPWVDTEFVLAMFGPTAGVARIRYSRFMQAYADEDVALFATQESRDTRALEPERARPPAPRPPGRRPTLEEIAVRHCAEAGITEAELSSPSRQRRLSSVRTAIAMEARATSGASLEEIARFLGRTASALAQSMALARRRGPD